MCSLATSFLPTIDLRINNLFKHLSIPSILTKISDEEHFDLLRDGLKFQCKTSRDPLRYFHENMGGTNNKF